MSIVHVASNVIDKHEVLVKSIQAVAAEWNLLDAKGHATARKGGELLEKYEDSHGHRKYTEMVESGVFHLSKSTCQKWMRVWKNRKQIKEKCEALGLNYETIGLTHALDLIRTPRNQGKDEEPEGKAADDSDAGEGEVAEPGDGDKNEEQETELVEDDQEQVVDNEKAPTPGIASPAATSDPETRIVNPPDTAERRAAAGEDPISKLADDALENFRLIVPLQEIRERVAKEEAAILLMVTVQAMATDGDKSILGQGTAETPIQGAWLVEASEANRQVK